MYPFERFTENSKKVLTLAQDEAERSHHSYIGTEHLLLGLLREGEGRAAQVLSTLGVEIDEVRATIASVLGRNKRIKVQQIIPTSRVKKVIEMAFEEAKAMGEQFVGSDHLLLGLIREGEGIAAHVLENLGVDAARVLANLPADEEDHGPEEPARWPGGHSGRAGFRTVGSGVAAAEAGALGDLSRFSSEAKSALALAEEEAVKAGGGYLGTEHLLAGLVRQGEGTAARLLLARGVTLERLRQELSKHDPPSPRLIVPTVLPTNAFESSLARARKVARRGLTPWVDTQHLLAALLPNSSELAVQLLTALGVDAAQIRADAESAEGGTAP